MSFPGFLSKTHFNYKRGLFRRDVEGSFYSGRQFPFPKISALNPQNIAKYKAEYPFRFADSAEEYQKIGKILNTLESSSEIISAADKVIENRFDFPAREDVYLGNKVRWNTDYLSGYEWPMGLSWKTDFFNYPEGTDILNPWMLARLNQLIILGKAYLSTSGKKYAEHYKYLLKNFMEENPFCSGVNWVNTREAAIRMLNIIFSISFFLPESPDDYEFQDQVKNDILLHAVFVENNLQHEDRGYSYFISNAALAAAGLVLRDSYYGQKILRMAYSNSEQMIRKYISPGGISDIRSVQYHPHVIEAFTIMKHCFEKAGIRISELFKERYHKMFDALASMIRDDNTAARIGDDFIGRVLPFSGRGSNLRFPLSIGIVETGKGTLKQLAQKPSADLLFFKGMPALDEFNSIETKNYARISYGYRHSGLFILRNDDIHITVDASDISSGRRRTKGHADILSFELFYKGHQVIIDPGTYSLYSSGSIRERLRSVKSHNTLYIDDEEPVSFEGALIKEDLTKPKVTEWHSDEYEDILSVQHYAYTRFPDPVVIKRIFRLQKEKNKLTIRDELFGGSTHQVFGSYIFHPGIEIAAKDNDIFEFYAPVKGQIIVSASSGTINGLIQDTIYSPSYGKAGQTKKILLTLSAQFPLYITTEFILK